jgi:large subunit ribosomal protein L4
MPRSYDKKMPRKMRRAALRSALSVKAAEQQLIVVDNLTMPAPKTKEMVRVLKNLAASDKKVLILLPEANDPVELSGRNLPNVNILRAQYLNIRDLLVADLVIVPLSALEVIESFLGRAA